MQVEIGLSILGLHSNHNNEEVRIQDSLLAKLMGQDGSDDSRIFCETYLHSSSKVQLSQQHVWKHLRVSMRMRYFMWLSEGESLQLIRRGLGCSRDLYAMQVIDTVYYNLSI